MVTLKQLQKYNIPGPRYTSYPPATHFTQSPTIQTAPTGALSLYFHLPFCTHQCLYCGCTNVITNDRSQSKRYLDYLEKEMQMRTAYISSPSPVLQIQWGGGSPSFLQNQEIEQLGAQIKQHFHIDKNVEFGVELDPRNITQSKIAALKKAGCNRVSLGIQDTNKTVQKAIARIQPLEQVAKTTTWLRESGIQSLNFDLIYGLPHQTPQTFSKTIDEILYLNPDRLAVYSYAHIPWIKPFQKPLENKLPSTKTKLQLLQIAIEKITTAGYIYIGMDHFAKPKDPLAIALKERSLQRNFQGYSTLKGLDLHGFGMSSISHIKTQYFQNKKELSNYYADLDADQLPLLRGYNMTPEDQIRYQIIMHIMCNIFINYHQLSTELNIDFPTQFKNEIASLDDLEQEGLLERNPDGIHVTSLGRLFVRIIAMRFDPHQKKPPQKRRYSNVV